MIEIPPTILGIIQFTDNCSACPTLSNTTQAPHETENSRTYYNYLMFLFTFINILANLFSLFILRHSLWNNSILAQLLQGISLFETIFNCFLFIQTLSQHSEIILTTTFDLMGVKAVGYVELSLLIFDVFVVTFQISRNWSIVLLAFYRYQMVCRATSDKGRHLTHTMFNKRKIYSMFMVIALLSFILAFPRIFEVLPIICSSNGKICRYQDHFTNNLWFQYLYIGAILFLFQSYGPVIIVIVLSCLVIQTINQQSSSRTKRLNHSASLDNFNNNNKSQVIEANLPNKVPGNINLDTDMEYNSCNVDNCEFKSTKLRRKSRQKIHRNSCSLVLLLSISFAVLETPSFFSKLVWVIGLKLSYLSELTNFLICLDSTINLVVYLISNSTFRLICRHLFCRNILHNVRTSAINDGVPQGSTRRLSKF